MGTGHTCAARRPTGGRVPADRPSCQCRGGRAPARRPDSSSVLRCAARDDRPDHTQRGATVRPNRIKQMWRDGKFVTLGWLSVSHGFTAEVMARQGFDALCVDMQHGMTDMNDVWPMLQAISQTDTVPVVRVPWNDPATIMKVLDFGAYGIIVPL